MCQQSYEDVAKKKRSLRESRCLGWLRIAHPVPICHELIMSDMNQESSGMGRGVRQTSPFLAGLIVRPSACFGPVAGIPNSYHNRPGVPVPLIALCVSYPVLIRSPCHVSLCIVHCSLFIVPCSSFIVHCLLSIVYCSLLSFFAYCSFLIACRLLSIIFCSMSPVCYCPYYCPLFR